MTSAGDHRVLILAGGLGTRLRPVVGDLPKALAPVGGRPFLGVLIERLHARGLRRLGLLLGYRHELVEAYLGELAPRYPELEVAISVEPSPLGTAGALRHAAALCRERFFLMNGDTHFDFDPAALAAAHQAAGALVTMATTVVQDSGRYGAVELAPDGRVRGFREKDPARGPGVINAGVYLCEPRLIDYIPAGAVSLENQTFPRLLAAGERVQAASQDGGFVDIGTAEGLGQLETTLRGS